MDETVPAWQTTQELFAREKKQPAQQPHGPQSQDAGVTVVVGGDEGGGGLNVVKG
jgi:hypothetical protein